MRDRPLPGLLCGSVLLGAAAACNPDLEPIVGVDAAGGAAPSTPVGDPFVGAWHFDGALDDWDVYELTPPDVLAGTTATWDGSAGDPAAGAARLEIPFSASEQQMRFGYRFPDPVDLRGTAIQISLWLESGLNVDPAEPGGAHVYVLSGDWIWANGPWVMLQKDTGWITATLQPSDPTAVFDGFDAADVREIGVMILTGVVGDHVPAVVYVDAITVTAP